MVKTIDLDNDEIDVAADALSNHADLWEKRAAQCEAAGDANVAVTYRAMAAKARSLVQRLEDLEG